MKRYQILIARVLIFATLCILVSMAYFYYGHRVISAIYEGKSLQLFNKLIDGRNTHPLGFYYKKADWVFSISLFLFVIVILSFYSLSKKWSEIRTLIKRSLLEISLKSCVQTVYGKVRAHTNFVIIIPIILFIFFGLYFSNSLLLSRTSAFKQDDLLFEVDTWRMVNDITDYSADHYRTKVHPLYVLIVNPWGSLIKTISHSNIIAAIAVNSLLGAFGVCLAFIFIYILSRNNIDALLGCCIFGLSMSQIFFSTVPDTGSLAICSLIVTYTIFWVSLQRKRMYFVLWTIAGILSLGVTTTNFIQTLICFVISAMVVKENNKEDYSTISKIAGFIIIVISVTILLSLIQKMIYPSSSLFFLPTSYAEEVVYTSLLIIKHPLAVTLQVLIHFFLFNIVAPFPKAINYPGTSLPYLTFAGSWNYMIVGWFGAVLWICLILGGIVKGFSGKKKNIPFYSGVVLCLFLNMFLHSFYGIGDKGQMELFLYTGNVTFLVLSFLGSYLRFKKIPLRLFMILLSALIGVNNLAILQRIISIFK